ncbi:MAG: YkgJ family cysteine cluster protein [Candidatus Hodarchaeales archaeon]
MSEEKSDLGQKEEKIEEEVVLGDEEEKSPPQAEKTPAKKKYVFNCTKCGQCCEKRDYVPVSFEDIRGWTQSGVINSVFPHLKMRTFPAQVQGEVREVVSIVITASEEGGCPLFDQENKLCNIYQAMPLECLAFPLGFNGNQYFIKDKSVPGLGNGVMNKEQLINDRDNARKDFEARVETQTLLPFTYTLFMQNLIEQQQKIREEMPEDKRKQLDDLLKAEESKE